MEDSKRRLFLWGALLAWVPALPLVFILMHALKDMSPSHAIGLAAFAGGLAEVYVPLGLLLTVVSEVVAIALLVKSFARGQSARSALAAASISCGVVVAIAFALFGWIWFRMSLGG